MKEQMLKQAEADKTKQDNKVVQRLVYTILGTVSAVLALRYVYKLLGENPDNVFLRGIHDYMQPAESTFESENTRRGEPGPALPVE
jgi:fermentation-respiration switch protein FrsA (DUF1100 family)